MRTYPRIKETNFNEKELTLGKNIVLTLSKKYYDKNQIKLYKEVFKNFTADVALLKVALVEGDAPTAVLSAQAVSSLPNTEAGEYDYSLKIDDKKAELHFHDKNSLAHALSTILTLVEVRSTKRGAEAFTLPQGTANDAPIMGFRSVHLCVFAETKYSLTRKYVRLAGLMKMTHVVIEFWGMYKFKCFKEGAREGAYTEKQVRALVADANAMGVEMIPMLNILGHASLNRLRGGKHAVLDNYPKLAPLFDPSGWNWNILNPDVCKLHKAIISELIDLFGEGKYVHLGCDEAFGYGDIRTFQGKDKYEVMYRYINEMSQFVKEKGRLPMAWADMFIYRNPEWIKAGCACNAESEEIGEMLLEKLDHDIVMVDWEYFLSCKDIPATKYLADHGYKVILAPWNQEASQSTCVDNVERFGYMGIMLTTWADVYKNFIYMTGGTLMWNGTEDTQKHFRTFGVGGAAVKAGINYYLRNLYKTKRFRSEENGIVEHDIEV